MHKIIVKLPLMCTHTHTHTEVCVCVCVCVCNWYIGGTTPTYHTHHDTHTAWGIPFGHYLI